MISMPTLLASLTRLVVVACSLGVSNALSQQSATEVDLKAAYCIKVVQAELQYFSEAKQKLALEAFVPREGPTAMTAEDIAYVYVDFRNQANDRLNRLHSYIFPKLKSVDPSAVQGAMNRGERDGLQYYTDGQMNESNATMRACMQVCPSGAAFGECLNACMERRNDLYRHIVVGDGPFIFAAFRQD